MFRWEQFFTALFWFSIVLCLISFGCCFLPGLRVVRRRHRSWHLCKRSFALTQLFDGMQSSRTKELARTMESRHKKKAPDCASVAFVLYIWFVIFSYVSRKLHISEMLIQVNQSRKNGCPVYRICQHSSINAINQGGYMGTDVMVSV